MLGRIDEVTELYFTIFPVMDGDKKRNVKCEKVAKLLTDLTEATVSHY